MPYEPRYKTLVDIFDDATQRYGSRQLFGTKKGGSWRWTTYSEFGQDVARLRRGLASLRIGRGDRVAIVSDNRVEWAVAAYACYGLGAAFVPMYEAQNPKEWEFIARDCEATTLFVANARVLAKANGVLEAAPSLKHLILIDGGTNGDGRVRSYESLLTTGGEAAAIRPAPADIAAVIYTSGTTGHPKGVMLSHENIASNVSAVLEVVPLENNDRSLSFLPWAHVFGQTVELHALFLGGASMAICEGVDKILDDLAEVRPTVLLSVPRIFNKIYTAVHKQIDGAPKPIRRLVTEALKVTAKERAGERLKLHELALLELADRIVFRKVRARFGGRLKFAVSGGAALSREVAEFIDSMGIVVYEGYGLTESSPIVSTNVPGSHKIGSVGRPIPGVRVEIDAASGERRPAENGKPARVEGEVIIHGPNVMKGYLNRPEENAAVFTKDGGLRTGDVGYLDAHGFLYITGRIKEQYKLENGKYVVPTPLEEQLKLSPYVVNAFVYGDGKPFNVAILVADVPAVQKWARDGQVTVPSDPEALLKDEQVRSLLRREVDKQSVSFKGFESIQDFAVIPTDFTTENGMLTPSLKLKRRKVIEAYGALLEEMYARKKADPRAAAAARAPQS